MNELMHFKLELNVKTSLQSNENLVGWRGSQWRMQTALQPSLRELPQKLLLEGKVSVLEGKLGLLVTHWFVLAPLCSCLLPQGEQGDKHHLFSPLNYCLGCP